MVQMARFTDNERVVSIPWGHVACPLGLVTCLQEGGVSLVMNGPSFPLNKKHNIQEEDMVQQLKTGMAQAAS